MSIDRKQDSQNISRRRVLQAGVFGSAALMRMAHVAGASEKPGDRPNILFLMGDQHRGDCIGADGNRSIITPNLDRLANEGARFRCAYSSTPSCTPARAGILTGLSPWNHGMLGFFQVAKKYPHEMPRMISAAGYDTLGIGKMHFHPQRNTHGYRQTLLDESGRVHSKGFVSDYRQWFKRKAQKLDPDATGIGWNDHRAKAYVLPERLHPTAWTGDEAVRFLENHKDPTPFLLKVSFARPHSPYDAPPRWWNRYKDAELPERVLGDWCERHAQRGKKHNNALWQGDLGAEKAREARVGYYGNISFIDEQIGRMLAVLEKRGQLENTLILYTADHGDMTGDHHLWRKTYAYEPSVQIPMIVRGPASMGATARGQVISQPVELRDIMPTFLESAGIGFETEQYDGRSMIDLIRGKSEGWRDYIDLEHSACYSPMNQWTALTDGRMKYIYYAPDGRQQLFDLEQDPGETRDLSGVAEHEPNLHEWRGRMIDHLSERGEPFVVSGDLGIRKKRTLLSPNYPQG